MRPAVFLSPCCDNYLKAQCGIGALPGQRKTIM
ncbi:UPF0231 family protein, partial [Salmonella enterica subsp. enterica serovar Kentucky]